MTTCFMVDEVSDCWADDGTPRAGAMTWRRHQLDAHDRDPRPMPHLAVMTPAGLVCLDCPSTDPPHGHWTRTGAAPGVTVMPSLNVNRGEWHGWLTGGQLLP